MAEIINQGPNPRFVAGRLIPVGEPYDPEAAENSEAYVTATTPAGQLSVEQLEALLSRKRGQATDDVTRKLELEGLRGSTGVDILNTDVALAPTGPTGGGDVTDITPKEVNAMGADPVRPLDRDRDGADGGSLKKAEIAAQLTAAGVKYDSSATRDDLQKLLDEHNKA